MFLFCHVFFSDAPRRKRPLRIFQAGDVVPLQMGFFGYLFAQGVPAVKPRSSGCGSPSIRVAWRTGRRKTDSSCMRQCTPCISV
jgi:hypothetical protein